MPSDERVESALRALRAPIDAFRAAAAVAAERVRGYAASASEEGSARTERTRAELGAFAGGRIDAAQFAAFFSGARVVDRATRSRLERAEQVLREIAALPDASFVVDVPTGADLGAVVRAAYARLGRAFGAALVAELARSGALDAASHDALLESLPPERWNRGERRLAPPLVVSVDGADVRASALADLIDEGTRLVLVVRGACAPAPLVALVTPGTLVLQTTDAAALERIAGSELPAVAALVPATAASFVHDPTLGTAPWQRIALGAVPAEAPRKAIGVRSVWQQSEELAQLRALASRPVLAVGEAAHGDGPPADTAADRLAAWLLQQARLTELH